MSVDGPDSQPNKPNVYEQIVAATGKRHRLLSVHWELTYRCNEKCSHCYLDVFAPHADVPGELTTEECIRIMDELAVLGVLNLTLSGGEVFVRRDIFQLAEYARSKKFLLRFFTNGILITPEMADRIAALHPYAVELSLYSTHPEVHDRITRLNRSWELTTRAVRLLRERNVRVQVKTPLMRENFDELDAFRAFAEETGSQFRYDVTVTPKDSGALDPLQHRVTFSQLVTIFQKELQSSEWLERKMPDNYRTCGISMNSLVIDPYGNVFPCVQVRSKMGNIHEQSVKEIWESSPEWNQVNNLTMAELPICRTCELQTLCKRCHGLALVEDGNLHAPAAVNCREALARRKVLINRGELPENYPIPTHLQEYSRQVEAGIDPIADPKLGYIPLATLASVRSARAELVTI